MPKKPRVRNPEDDLRKFLAQFPRFREKFADYRKRGPDRKPRKRRDADRRGGRSTNFGEAAQTYTIRMTPTAIDVAKRYGSGPYLETLLRRKHPEEFSKKEE